jgi:drug/metabolite transporter (DMT)-like permease
MLPENGHSRGTSLAFIGVLVLSFDALLVRLAEASAANVTFWRGVFIALSVTVALRLLRGRWPWTEVVLGGRLALLLVVLMGLMQALFVTAIMNTRVANVVVILTVAPLFAALFSGLFLREWIPRRTWIAILLSILGIGIVFGGAIGAGSWFGDSLALLGAIVVGINFTLLRHLPGVSRLALIAGGGLVTCLIALPMGAPTPISGFSLGVLAVMGLLQMPLALVMMTEATRFLPSAEVTLFFTLEAVFGTFWVWAVLGEEPPPATLVGGTLVVATLIVHSWIGIRREQRG